VIFIVVVVRFSGDGSNLFLCFRLAAATTPTSSSTATPTTTLAGTFFVGRFDFFGLFHIDLFVVLVVVVRIIILHDSRGFTAFAGVVVVPDPLIQFVPDCVVILGRRPLWGAAAIGCLPPTALGSGRLLFSLRTSDRFVFLVVVVILETYFVIVIFFVVVILFFIIVVVVVILLLVVV